MVDKEFIFREYIPSDVPIIVEFLDEVFQGWPKFDLKCSKVEHWKWKYIENPLKKMAVTLCFHGDTLVGTMHSLSRIIHVHGKDYLAGQGADLAVHPDYRGRGIYNAMTENQNEIRKRKGYVFTTFQSGNPIVIQKAYRRNYPRLPSPLNMYYRIDDLNHHLEKKNIKQSWIKKIGYKSLKLYSTRFRPLNLYRKKQAKIDVEKNNTFDCETENFYNAIKQEYDFIVSRTSQYLNWRYSDPRAGEFYKIIARDNGEVVGYLVFRINKYNDYPEALIVDFLLSNARVDVFTALLDEALSSIDRENVNSVLMYLNKGHPFERTLRSRGFIDVRNPEEVFLYGIDDKSEVIASIQKIDQVDLQRIHYQTGDSDWI